MNIGQLAKHLILNSKKSNADILKIIQAKFPEAKTSAASMAWYRSDLRKKGLLGKGEGKNNIVLSQDELDALCAEPVEAEEE